MHHRFAIVLFACLHFFAAASLFAQLEKGPYIQNVSENSATVVWYTTGATPGTFKYGPSLSNLNTTVTTASDDVHTVVLSGLSPDTRYYYSVGNGSTVYASGDAYYFETYPVPATSTSFRFTAFGDCGTGDQYQYDTAEQLELLSPRSALHLLPGDIVYNNGGRKRYQERYFDVYWKTIRNVVFWPALGNHDVNNSCQGCAWFEFFYTPANNPDNIENYYSFDYGPAHFVVLDDELTREQGKTDQMLDWMDQDLEDAKARGITWLIAIFHKAPYSRGSRGDDEFNQTNLVPRLEAQGVDLVISGHSHAYERSYLLNNNAIIDNNQNTYSKNGHGPGTLYIVNGVGGGKLGVISGKHALMAAQYGGISGVSVFDIDGNTLTGFLKKSDGTVIDNFSLSKNGGGGGNQPPTAVAEANPTSGTAPLDVNFTGSNSSDPDGTIQSYSWDFGDGNSSTLADPSHTYSSAGTYTAVLTVTDNQGATGTDQVVITVNSAGGGNQPPTAVAEANPTSGTAPLDVNFTGSNSSDPDGTIQSYSWDFGDGNSSTLADPSHTYSSAGTYTAVLTVTDDQGATGTDQVVITVNSAGGGNQPPVATITSPTEGQNFPSGSTISYSGTGTDPEDGDLPAANFTWTADLPNGTKNYPIASGTKSGSIFAQLDGDYTLYLEVYDSQGATDRDTVHVSVGASGGNQPPTAVAEATPTSGTAPLTVNFTGSNSSDPDGSIQSYSWDFGDGASSTVADPSHTYSSAGTYTAVLTVTDDQGATGTDQVVITVNGAANTPPVASITEPADGSVFVVNDIVTYSGTGTDAEDGDLPAANFTWTADLPNGMVDYPVASGVKSGQVQLSLAGNYVLRLKVVDSQGAEATDEIQITANPSATMQATTLAVQQNANTQLAEAILGQPGVHAINLPNPFNPETIIYFRLQKPVSVRLAIYDIRGRQIRVLLHDEPFTPGIHRVRWDGRNQSGANVASGMYFYVVQMGSEKIVKQKMLLLR